MKKSKLNEKAVSRALTIRCVLNDISRRETSFYIGVEQEIPDDWKDNTTHIIDYLEVIKETSVYMTEVMTSNDYLPFRENCFNSDAYCSHHAANGACDDIEDDFYDYMMKECAPACQTCGDRYDEELIERCVPNKTKNIIEKGDLDIMFKRIVGELPNDEAVVPDYKVKIHSRPSDGLDENQGFFSGPWIVTLEDFLTAEECDKLISLGAGRGYERSTLETEEDEDDYAGDLDPDEELWDTGGFGGGGLDEGGGGFV